MRAIFSDFKEVASLQELVTVLSRVEDFVASTNGHINLMQVNISIEVDILESSPEEEEEKA